MTPYVGDAEPPRLTCWRLTTTRVGGGGFCSFMPAPPIQEGPSIKRVHTLACILKSCLVVCFLAGGISYSSGPPIFVYTYISAYCRNRITTSHAPASTTAFRILITCNGKWPVANPSAPRCQRGQTGCQAANPRRVVPRSARSKERDPRPDAALDPNCKNTKRIDCETAEAEKIGK